MPGLEFEIMSVITVGTPHNGSRVARVANVLTPGNNLSSSQQLHRDTDSFFFFFFFSF
jgi:hypothetical protein